MKSPLHEHQTRLSWSLRITQSLRDCIFIVLACLSAAVTADTEFDCLIEPSLQTSIGSPTEGVLETVDVERGQHVSAGQVLATLQADVEKATVALARARAKSHANKDSANTRIQFAARKLSRLNNLIQKDFVSSSQIDEAETEKKLAQLDEKLADENIAVAQQEFKRSIALLELRTIRSPINGIVVERLNSPGEYVREKPILKLAQIDPLFVEVILPISMLDQVKVGTSAMIYPEFPQNSHIQAQVSLVDKVVDAASGTFGVRAQINNPEHTLLAGLKCKISFMNTTANKFNSKNR